MHVTQFRLALTACTLLVLLVSIPLAAQTETREVRIQLTSTAEIDAADLFIDGVPRGIVRKGIANTVSLTLGQHSFAMRRVVNGVEYKREKSEMIVAGATPQFVFFASHKAIRNISPDLRHTRGPCPTHKYVRSRVGNPVR